MENEDTTTNKFREMKIQQQTNFGISATAVDNYDEDSVPLSAAGTNSLSVASSAIH